MTMIKISITRFIFSYITICANWKYSLGLNPNYVAAFAICLIGEMSYMFIAILLKNSIRNKNESVHKYKETIEYKCPACTWINRVTINEAEEYSRYRLNAQFNCNYCGFKSTIELREWI